MSKIINKKTKAFFGPIDVANIANSFVKLLRNEGYIADFYTYSNINQSFGYGSGKKITQVHFKFYIFGKNIFGVLNLIINLIIKRIFIFHILINYNTFFYISPHTILKQGKELKLLKFFNKKIIILFVGCCERDVNFLKNDDEYICNRCEDIKKRNVCLCDKIELKKDRVRNYEKYSSYILAQDDSAGYLLNKKNIWMHLFAERPLNNDFIKKFEREKIRIMHFPSNPKIKLSNIIIPVLKKIKEKYDNIELVIKTNIPHKEVLDELNNTHIVVDALGLSYGMLAIEAMARGCVVLAGDFDFVNDKIPDLAIVGVNSNNLFDKLEELILNKELLIRKAKDSLKFYNKYHSLEAAAKYYKENLKL